MNRGLSLIMIFYLKFSISFLSYFLRRAQSAENDDNEQESASLTGC